MNALRRQSNIKFRRTAGVGVVAASVMIGACTGFTGDDGSGGVGGTGGTGSPKTLSEIGGSVLPLRPLTPYELRNTISDILGDEAPEIAELQPVAVAQGIESLGGTGFLFEGAVADTLDDAFYRVASRVTTGKGMLSSCAAQTGSFECLKALYADLLPRLHRGDPSVDTTIEALVKVATDNEVQLGRPDAIARSLEAALLWPSLLYLTSIGSEGKPTGELSALELASRMSYTAWSSAPDRDLLKAATSGMLVSQAQIEGQAKRLLADPRSARGISRFVLGWAGALNLGKRNKSAGKEWTAEIARDAVQESQAFLSDWWLGAAPTFSGLLNADHSFVTERLASYYGVPFPGGSGVQRVKWPSGSTRTGLLTQALWLAASSGSERTSPTQRGRWVYERALCRTIVAPADIQGPDGPSHMANDQTRDFHERLMTAKCSGACHTQLEPLGFAFEGFDGIGRAQSVEAGRPVRTDAKPTTGSDIDAVYTDAKSFSRGLSASDTTLGCAAEYLAAHGLGRVVGEPDAALTAQLKTGLRTNARDAMFALISSPVFRRIAK